MSDIGDLYRLLKSAGIRKKLKKGKNCHISGKSIVDYKTCFFEGDNQVGKFSILHHCVLGRGSYVSESSVLERMQIGRYCSIGPHVHVVHGRHPSREYVSTHPAFYAKQTPIYKSYVAENSFEEFVYANKEKQLYVTVGNDVWIGDGALLMEGVHIADGTIIAAGAVVVKDTEPYSIVGGNPAKCIRYRFGESDISFLLNLEWWNKGEDWITQNAGYFKHIDILKEIASRERSIEGY